MSVSEQRRVSELERQVALLEVQVRNTESELAQERTLRSDPQTAQSAVGPSGLTIAELEEFAGYCADDTTAYTMSKVFGNLLVKCGIDSCRKFAALITKRRPRMKTVVAATLSKIEKVANVAKISGRLPAGWR